MREAARVRSASDYPRFRTVYFSPCFIEHRASLPLSEPGTGVRLAGLDLNANRSGKTSDASIPVISKKGDADLRYGLNQGALIASYHNEAFRRLYNRLLEGRQGERGIQTKMRVKLAAKILIIAWTMLKKGEPFDVTRLGPEPEQQR